MNINTGIHSNIEGFYKLSIVDADGKTIIWEDSKWRKNLILNNGMDMIYSYPYQQVFHYGIGGTGTRLNSIDSDLSTISQSGYIVALNPLGTLTSFTQSAGEYTNAVEIGDILKYDTGSGGTSEVTVTQVSPLSCSVNINQTISTGEQFTIWKTSQTSLQYECARGGGYPEGQTGPSGSYWVNGLCGSQVVGNVYQLWRTIDFGPASITTPFTEVGVSPSATRTATNTFSRIVLPSPITVLPNQRLRLAYQLNVSMMPSASVYRSGSTVPLITGWPAAPSTTLNATESLQNPLYSIEGISSNGKWATYDGFSSTNHGYPLDPYSANQFQTGMSTNSSSLAAFGSAVQRDPLTGGYATMAKASYPGVGSYYCDKTCTFTVGQGNSNSIRSIYFGYLQPYQTTYQLYCLLFNQPQTKYNTQTLTLSWRFSWNRTLSNGA